MLSLLAGHRLIFGCVAGLFLAVLLPLAGCAEGAGRWGKPGASPDLASQDLAACRGEARAALRDDTAIDNDIMASRGNDWMRNGTLVLKRDDMAARGRARSDALIQRCMSAKGYARAG